MLAVTNQRMDGTVQLELLDASGTTAVAELAVATGSVPMDWALVLDGDDVLAVGPRGEVVRVDRHGEVLERFTLRVRKPMPCQVGGIEGRRLVLFDWGRVLVVDLDSHEVSNRVLTSGIHPRGPAHQGSVIVVCDDRVVRYDASTLVETARAPLPGPTRVSDVDEHGFVVLFGDEKVWRFDLEAFGFAGEATFERTFPTGCVAGDEVWVTWDGMFDSFEVLDASTLSTINSIALPEDMQGYTEPVATSRGVCLMQAAGEERRLVVVDRTGVTEQTEIALDHEYAPHAALHPDGNDVWAVDLEGDVIRFDLATGSADLHPTGSPNLLRGDALAW